MSKANEAVRIELPKEDLRMLYDLAVKIYQPSVIYNQDALEMAKQAIFEMRKDAEKIAIYLNNKGVTSL